MVTVLVTKEARTDTHTHTHTHEKDVYNLAPTSSAIKSRMEMKTTGAGACEHDRTLFIPYNSTPPPAAEE